MTRQPAPGTLRPVQHRAARQPAGQVRRPVPARAQAPFLPLARTVKRGGSNFALGLSGTPGRLALLRIVTVIAAILCGLFGYLGGSAQSRALDAARADTTQLSQAQDVRNTLVAANASATNAFLVGGLEPIHQRTAYDEAIQSASDGLIRLAATRAGDLTHLQKANAGLPQYTGLIEQARATNRQGFPVGSAYLDQASTLLRDTISENLDVVVLESANRASDDFAKANNAGAYLTGTLVFAVVLVAGQVWLARRTRRVINLGIGGGTLLLLVAGGIVAVTLGNGSAAASEVRSGSYAGTLAASQAYALANDARAMESFTLIKRGSGAQYEEAFAVATTDAIDRLTAASDEGTVDRKTVVTLQSWIDKHAQIRALDDAGDWDGAVELAISEDDDSPTAAFQKFEEATHAEVERTADIVLRDGARTARVAGWAMLIAGLAAAVLAWGGATQRLKEYR